jgi:hypothetical protein
LEFQTGAAKDKPRVWQWRWHRRKAGGDGKSSAHLVIQIRSGARTDRVDVKEAACQDGTPIPGFRRHKQHSVGTQLSPGFAGSFFGEEQIYRISGVTCAARPWPERSRTAHALRRKGIALARSARQVAAAAASASAVGLKRGPRRPFARRPGRTAAHVGVGPGAGSKRIS